jgi:hypothetical protein
MDLRSIHAQVVLGFILQAFRLLLSTLASFSCWRQSLIKRKPTEGHKFLPEQTAIAYKLHVLNRFFEVELLPFRSLLQSI